MTSEEYLSLSESLETGNEHDAKVLEEIFGRKPIPDPDKPDRFCERQLHQELGVIPVKIDSYTTSSDDAFAAFKHACSRRNLNPDDFTSALNRPGGFQAPYVGVAIWNKVDQKVIAEAGLEEWALAWCRAAFYVMSLPAPMEVVVVERIISQEKPS